MHYLIMTSDTRIRNIHIGFLSIMLWKLPGDSCWGSLGLLRFRDLAAFVCDRLDASGMSWLRAYSPSFPLIAGVSEGDNFTINWRNTTSERGMKRETKGMQVVLTCSVILVHQHGVNNVRNPIRNKARQVEPACIGHMQEQFLRKGHGYPKCHKRACIYRRLRHTNKLGECNTGLKNISAASCGCSPVNSATTRPF